MVGRNWSGLASFIHFVSLFIVGWGLFERKEVGFCSFRITLGSTRGRVVGAKDTNVRHRAAASGVTFGYLRFSQNTICDPSLSPARQQTHKQRTLSGSLPVALLPVKAIP